MRVDGLDHKNAEGPTIFARRQKSLSDVRSDAAEQAVYDAAHALFGLAQYPVIDVLYRKNFELSMNSRPKNPI
ncbi:DUF1659 domain-containing protein [Desulfosporosinus metallidurans]|uniref:DUF1659 domain-containing protein n=1 Tax=Desulfosporosinus metallidurans TaxID=1888891 RepID=UPI00094DC311|nr:DUF1659 domain-containing protein [Desulfosporosinus metallidurans]